MGSAAHSPTGRRIGFVSMRFAGTDGVSLETAKWAAVLERMGHGCFYFAGEADTPPECSRVVAEAFWEHPDVDEIQTVAFAHRTRPSAISRRIAEVKEHLKEQLYAFTREFDLDLLIVENALSIPMNLPLGLALTEFIAETAFPTIAHHHDFFWERKRFLTNCVWDYLNMSFPPNLPSIRHVVINSSGAHQLGLRAGVSSLLIPNVMDFDNPPPPPDAYVADMRAHLHVTPDEHMVLQPTRVVQRKGIEHAMTADGRKIYTLEDAYLQTNLVTYPSTIEGFGNAFLEAIYFRRPIVVNAYSIFAVDIKPKGFRVIEFDGYITDEIVRQTGNILEHPELGQQMAEHNYQLAKRFYSYAVLDHSLKTLLIDLFGMVPAHGG